MFVLTIDNKAYTVDFKHWQRGTQCWIIADATGENTTIESFGESIRNTRDNPCKSIGRKLSLARALEKFDKPTRTLFWQEYHKKSRGTR